MHFLKALIINHQHNYINFALVKFAYRWKHIKTFVNLTMHKKNLQRKNTWKFHRILSNFHILWLTAHQTSWWNMHRLRERALLMIVSWDFMFGILSKCSKTMFFSVSRVLAPLWSQTNAMVCLFATGRRKATGAWTAVSKIKLSFYSTKAKVKVCTLLQSRAIVPQR